MCFVNAYAHDSLVYPEGIYGDVQCSQWNMLLRYIIYGIFICARFSHSQMKTLKSGYLLDDNHIYQCL